MGDAFGPPQMNKQGSPQVNLFVHSKQEIILPNPLQSGMGSLYTPDHDWWKKEAHSSHLTASPSDPSPNCSYKGWVSFL